MASALFWVQCARLCVCGGGIIPNVLSAVVLVKERNSISGAWILLGLAVADGGVLFVGGCRSGVFCWFGNIPFRNYQDTFPRVILDAFADPIFRGLGHWFFMAEIYLVIALAVGRYIAVSKPHLAQKWNSRERQRTTVVVVFIATLAITLPRFLENRLIINAYADDTSILDSQSNQSTQLPRDLTSHWNGVPTSPYFGFTPTKTADNASNDSKEVQPSKSLFVWYHLLYINIFRFALLYLIPLPCIFIINIRFLRGLRLFQNRRKRFGQMQTEFTSSRQIRVILNVVVLLIIFLLCQASSGLIWIYLRVVGNSHPDAQLLRQIGFFFTAINSATNFWVYLAFLKGFRNGLRRLAMCNCRMCASRQFRQTTDLRTTEQVKTVSNNLE